MPEVAARHDVPRDGIFARARARQELPARCLAGECVRSSVLGLFAAATAATILGQALAPPQAEPQVFALDWQDEGSVAPVDQAVFEQQLAERLGRNPFAAPDRTRRLQVIWQAEPAPCRVMIEVWSGDKLEGTRAIDSPSGDCSALGEPLLTIAALLVEAPAPEPQPEAPPAASAPPASKPAPASDPKLASAQARPPRSFSASVGAEGSLGTLPHPTLGGGFDLLGKVRSPLWLFAQLSLLPATQTSTTPGLRVRRTAAGFGACYVAELGPVDLGPCAGLQLGFWSSSGVRIFAPRSASTTAVSMLVTFRVEPQLVSRLRLLLRPGLELAPATLRFRYVDRETNRRVVFETPRFAPSAFIGLALDLG